MAWVVLCADGEDRTGHEYESESDAVDGAKANDTDPWFTCGPHTVAPAPSGDEDGER